jgi:hypothetical protein
VDARPTGLGLVQVSEQQLVSTDPNWSASAATPAGPRGSERTRVDTNAVGVDHEQLQQRIANWASTLPPTWQKPAAMLLTFPADVLGSLLETISAPESVATMGARPAMAALDATGAAAKAAPGAAVRSVAAVGDVVHPDVIGVASPRIGKVVAVAQRMRNAMDGAAADATVPPPADLNAPYLDRSIPVRPSELTPEQLAQRMQYGRGTPPPPSELRGRTVQRPTGATVAPAGRAPVVAPAAADPVAPAPPAVSSVRTDVPPATAAVPPEAPPAAPVSLGQALAKMKLTGKEVLEVQRLTKQGRSLQEALDLVQAQRDFQTRFGLSTPTADETRFPKGMRGGTRPLS